MSDDDTVKTATIITERADRMQTAGMEETKWSISLCEIGNCSSCLYSCCCPYCALAQARTNLDGSSLCFNLCFLTSCPERWMIRTAYGIKGNAYEDCYVPCCCPCCTANQLLQTTERLGDPFGPSPGEHFLRGNRFLGGSKANCVDCFKALCLPCAIASAVHTATGMPWLMGCCLSTPCANRNITKVHYRIGDTHLDFCEDGFCPMAGVACGYFFWPSLLCIGPFFLNWTIELLAEVKVRGAPSVPRYLFGTNARDLPSNLRTSSSSNDIAQGQGAISRKPIPPIATLPTATAVYPVTVDNSNKSATARSTFPNNTTPAP